MNFPLFNLVAAISRASNAGNNYAGSAQSILQSNPSAVTSSSAINLLNSDHAFIHNENQLSRDWQKEFANNQYQWTVNDLKEAGLNPILAVTGLNPGTVGGQSVSYSGGANFASAKETSGATVKSSEITAKATVLSSAIRVLGQIVSTGISSISGMITKGIPSTSTTTSYNHLFK